MTHTSGPWFVKESPGIGLGVYGQRGTLGVPVAWVYDTFAEIQEANTRLIAAACNSYDKHCGGRAIECAEQDLLGKLLAACEAFVEAWEKSHQLEKTDVAYRMAVDALGRARPDEQNHDDDWAEDAGPRHWLMGPDG